MCRGCYRNIQLGWDARFLETWCRDQKELQRERAGASRKVVRLVPLDKSLWHNVSALEAGGLPAWELPLLGRACSASASSPAPPFL